MDVVETDVDAVPVRRAIVIGCAAALILALATSGQVYLSMLNHGHSFARMFLWQLGSWGFWGVTAPVVLYAGGCLTGSRPVYQRLSGALILGAVLIAARIVVAALFAVWLQPFAPVEIHTFGVALLAQLPSSVVGGVFVYLMLLAGGSAWCAHRRARRLELRESRLEAALARSQLDALRLEIQPHFLFNTLNSIAALTRLRDHDGALKMLLGLSDMMRATIDRPADHLVTLGAEIEFVKRYVDLQRTRFSDRLVVDYAIDDDCHDASVPTLLLQPLVENALRHGAAPRPGTCRLQIGARAEGDRLRLWVADDGVGLPRGFDMGRHSGTGLSNTRSRLRQIYGAAASLDVRPGRDAGTTVEITVPFSSSREVARVAS